MKVVGGVGGALGVSTEALLWSFQGIGNLPRECPESEGLNMVQSARGCVRVGRRGVSLTGPGASTGGPEGVGMRVLDPS